MDKEIKLLATLLREAEEAHAFYEKGLGHRDDDWQSWYADFIVTRLEEIGTCEGV